ncbi:hypothetical protein NAC44_08030 [Allorhizobium sp. BGMRC 0089]|uniref:hypothetical protein n=1 Tax=Allorhizobium sonneratiae TaxID=2934936 RepID=UPI002034A247|nr:hypothetical protein [Allorhizobium sonneratiae]MCM2292274.1 hypothetical protein [Allorhizobium sonneratiae]
MELFDALPAAVRAAIAQAGFPFHPHVAWRFLRRGVSLEQVARLIMAADRRLMPQGGR